MSPFPYRTVSVPNRVRTVPCPYRIRTAIATVTVPFFSLTFGSAKFSGTSRAAYRTIKIYNVYLYTGPILFRYRDPYRTKTGTVRIAVLNNKRITVSILVRYGSRSNTKMRTVKINKFCGSFQLF